MANKNLYWYLPVPGADIQAPNPRFDDGLGARPRASGEAAGLQRHGQARAGKRAVAVATARRLDGHDLSMLPTRWLIRIVPWLGVQLPYR